MPLCDQIKQALRAPLVVSMSRNEQAVHNLREYLRIPSVHPDVNYDDCVSFLRRQAKELDLPLQVVTPVPGKPTVVLTWTGTQPHLPGVLLNSHMDVVPVYPEKWVHDPFGAHRDADGIIYGRGSQDMKCVGIQYLEAVRRLKESGVRLKRNVYISFVPDEEIGGVDGMQKFVTTPEFKKMNVGFALDESMPYPGEEIIVFYGERSTWQIEIHCPGTPGHGSILADDTAGEKVRVVLDRAMDFRDKEKQRLKDDSSLGPGDVTSLNVTMLKGGVQNNVIPPALSVAMDIRIAPTVDHTEFESMLQQWCLDAGAGTHVQYQQKGVTEGLTKLDDSNPWWAAFKSAADKRKLTLKTIICPGGTDARFIRRLGIPALGFSHLNRTPILLHDHNEHVREKVFLAGVEAYCEIIPALGNVPEQ